MGIAVLVWSIRCRGAYEISKTISDPILTILALVVCSLVPISATIISPNLDSRIPFLEANEIASVLFVPGTSVVG